MVKRLQKHLFVFVLFTNGDELEYNDATIAGCLNPGVMLREQCR